MTFNKWFNRRLHEFRRVDDSKNRFILHNIDKFINIQDLPLGDILKRLRPVVIKIEKDIGILPKHPNKPKQPKPSAPIQPSLPKPNKPSVPVVYDPSLNTTR